MDMPNSARKLVVVAAALQLAARRSAHMFVEKPSEERLSQHPSRLS
jgi:hypothetical protein